MPKPKASFGGPKSPKNVPAKSRADTVGDAESFVDWETYHNAIADRILAVIDGMAIDRARLLFSGYGLKVKKEDAREWRGDGTESRIRRLARNFMQLEALGKLDEDPELKRSYLDEIQQLKARHLGQQAGTHTYFFTDWRGLHAEGTGNPLAYVYADQGVIGVYDRDLFIVPIGIDDSEENAFNVTALPEDVEAAKILEFYPNFDTPTPTVSHAQIRGDV